MPCVTSTPAKARTSLLRPRNVSGQQVQLPADGCPEVSVAMVVNHLSGGNNRAAPGSRASRSRRGARSTRPPRDAMVARLKETFDFCTTAFPAKLDDSKLGELLPSFGPKGSTKTRAAIEMITAADWADHYSQLANYLRLNGMLPPTAKPKTAM